MKLVVASKNQHKLNEIIDILGDLHDFEIVSLSKYPEAPDVEEDGKTFEENAVKKAQAMAAFTGELVLADDSGLEVDALNGEPGVYSARYAGENASYEDLCAKLLKEMEGISKGQRKAKFKTVIALATPKRLVGTCKGICKGEIIEEMRGSKGFGYDPLFYYKPLRRTLAELEPEEKNKISHRHNALVKARTILENYLKRQ